MCTFVRLFRGKLPRLLGRVYLSVLDGSYLPRLDCLAELRLSNKLVPFQSPHSPDPGRASEQFTT